MPPKFVAVRSLDQLKSGKSPLWCLPFYIVEDRDESVVGSCGFKDAPIQEQVEIGYGISPDARGLGYATSAVTELLALAAATLQVKTVLAQVSELNIASTRVVQKLGFRALGAKLDHEGEMLVQWVYEIAA
jgi:RimJ/RimL family protein N-acetyltransferase